MFAVSDLYLSFNIQILAALKRFSLAKCKSKFTLKKRNNKEKIEEVIEEIEEPYFLIPKISRTYTTTIKLGTVILYLQKIKKIYESGDTLHEFC